MIHSMSGLAAAAVPADAEWIRRTVVGDVYSSLMLLAVLFSISMLAPNSQTLLRRFEPALNWKDYILPPTFFDQQLIWQPSILWRLFVGCCFALSVLSFSHVTEFIYFNF